MSRMAKKKLAVDSASARAKEEISSAAKAAVKDKKCINELIALFVHLDVIQDAADVDKLALTKAVASLKALVEAFQHFVASGDLEESDDPARSKVAEWLGERHETLWVKICSALSSSEAALAEPALVGVLRLIKAEHKRRTRTLDEDVASDHWKGEEVKRMRSLLPVYCSSKKCM